MRQLFFLSIISVFFVGCKGPDNDKQYAMQKQIDSLQTTVTKMKPGLGELMLSIQVHHAKLWFAGKNANWRLANFEVDEIKEILSTAEAIETDRPEIKTLPMIYPPIDSLTKAIQSKDTTFFKSSFITLTNTCNSCHHAVNFDFNVIKIPDNPPFSNQVFDKGTNN